MDIATKPKMDDGPGVAEQARARASGAETAVEQRQEAAVEAYARGHEELSEENESDALDYLLGPKPPLQYDVKVNYETDSGTQQLTFVVRSVSGRKIDEIEQRNRSETTGVIDMITADCELVAEACACIETKKGRKLALTSDEFLSMLATNPDGSTEMRRVASAAAALEFRFREQIGIVLGVGREIRRVSGYDAARVNQAQRRLVAASGN